MKTKMLKSLLIASVFVAAVAPVCRILADDKPTASVPDIYDESLDGAKQIADAVSQAGKEHKRVLLQFGANWCPWCHKLHAVFNGYKDIADALKADYVVAMIDVNKGHNGGLIKKYGAEQGFGLPFIVILESDGTHLKTKNTGELEEGNHHNPEKVMAFLKEWAPKR